MEHEPPVAHPALPPPDAPQPDRVKQRHATDHHRPAHAPPFGPAPPKGDGWVQPGRTQVYPAQGRRGLERRVLGDGRDGGGGARADRGGQEEAQEGGGLGGASLMDRWITPTCICCPSQREDACP